MKKSLLGLLVIALTLVGCQNYDDQFDELNTKILDLAKSVSELDGIRTQISDLGTTIANLKESSASTEDITEILTDLAQLTTDMAEIKSATDYATDETDSLEQEIDEIKLALAELLEQSAVIQQDIVITSAAQLDYVESLMALDNTADNTYVKDETREYIVSGNITVDATFVEDAAMTTRLNDVLARIASVITPDGGTGVSLHSGTAADKGADLTLTSMAFVQGSVTLEGFNPIDVSTLAALTSTLTLKQGGILTFDGLNQVGDVVIATTDSITTLDFSNVASSNGEITTAPGVLNAPALSGVVNIGAVGLPASVTINNVTALTAGAIANGVTLSATDASPVTLNGTTAFTADGNIDITAKGNVVINVAVASGTLDITSAEGAIHLNELTAINGAATLTSSESIMMNKLAGNIGGIVAKASAFHVPLLASNAGTLSVTASAYEFTALESNDGGIVLNGGIAVEMESLATSSATIVAPDATTFMAIALETATGTIDVKAGATIGVGDLADPTDLTDFANLVELQLHAQKTSIVFSTAVSMTTLTVLGKKNTPIVQNGQVNDVILTSSNTLLESLTVGGVLRKVSLDDTELESFVSVTGSTILDVDLQNNADLETITLAHDRLDGERALSITVINNDKVQTLDMSTVNKIKEIEVTGNATLTSITMAGYSPAVEPTASITVTISGNALAGEYTSATAGTDTTPYLEAAIQDDSGIICAVKGFVDYYTEAATTGSVTSSVDLDDVDLYTQEENASDVVVRTISDPVVNNALSAHIAADGNVTGFGGATDAIDSPADYALITCD
jgi:hypothetical protein